MAYDFQERIDRLGVNHKARNRKSVVYSRGDTSLTIIGSPIKTPADELLMGVSVIRGEYQDWIFDSVELLPTFTFPKIGDTIVQAGNTFKATSLGNDEPCFQFVTSSRKRIRVHTIRVAS